MSGILLPRLPDIEHRMRSVCLCRDLSPTEGLQCDWAQSVCPTSEPPPRGPAARRMCESQCLLCSYMPSLAASTLQKAGRRASELCQSSNPAVHGPLWGHWVPHQQKRVRTLPPSEGEKQCGWASRVPWTLTCPPRGRGNTPILDPTFTSQKPQDDGPHAVHGRSWAVTRECDFQLPRQRCSLLSHAARTVSKSSFQGHLGCGGGQGEGGAS